MNVWDEVTIRTEQLSVPPPDPYVVHGPELMRAAMNAWSAYHCTGRMSARSAEALLKITSKIQHELYEQGRELP